MHIDRVALLQQLAVEYNDLINTAASNFAPQLNHIDQLDREDDCLSLKSNDNEEEIDDGLNEVEDEMVLLVSDVCSKRKRSRNYDSFLPKKR